MQVEPGEVVVIVFWNLETIANEDQRSADFRRRHNPRADNSVFSKYERFALAIADERETAIFLDDLA